MLLDGVVIELAGKNSIIINGGYDGVYLQLEMHSDCQVDATAHCSKLS